MNKTNIKKFLLGSILVGGLTSGLSGCATKEQDNDDDNQEKTEVVSTKPQNDPHGNVALFEQSRSEIKFALAFVENYYPHIYWCGEAWTAGHGLTILYNADGTYKKVTQNTKVPTLEESDKFKGRYLTHEILPDIKKHIKVPMDKNTLIAACALRYCIGGKNFRKSSFVKQLNAGVTGAELAKTLTGWRKQDGIPNRMYFFAALMAGTIDFSDLLHLRAEGCYNLSHKDIFVYSDKKPKCDKNNYYEWDFSKIQSNIEKAKQPRNVTLNLSNGKKTVITCKPVKDIVPEYIWQEVSNGNASCPQFTEANTTTPEKENSCNPFGSMALGALGGALGTAAAIYGRKKYLTQKQKRR